MKPFKVSNYGLRDRLRAVELLNLVVWRRDMSLFSLRKSNPQHLGHLIAERCVERGINWLNKHAPTGWRRNMFEPRPDRPASFRPRTDCNTEGVLARAFEGNPVFIDKDRYVNEGEIARRFRLSNSRLRRLGFDPGIYSPRYRISIEGYALDDIWKRSLLARAESISPTPVAVEEKTCRTFGFFRALIGAKPDRYRRSITLRRRFVT